MTYQRLVLPVAHGAVALMVEIANRSKVCPVLSTELARTLDSSVSYVERLVRKLRRAGLVKTKLGPGGGSSLGKRPEKIFLLSIVLATENKPDTRRAKGVAAFSRQEPPRDVWEQMERLQHLCLSRLTLADVLNGRFNDHPVLKKAFNILQ